MWWCSARLRAPRLRTTASWLVVVPVVAVVVAGGGVGVVVQCTFTCTRLRTTVAWFAVFVVAVVVGGDVGGGGAVHVCVLPTKDACRMVCLLLLRW